jgi:hypothetical protein
MIHPAAKFQFERTLREYAQWRAVADSERSPAAAWWWAPAFAVAQVQDRLPADWPQIAGLQPEASYADAAGLLLDALADQTALPWPDDFPRKYRPAHADAAASPPS